MTAPPPDAWLGLLAMTGMQTLMGGSYETAILMGSVAGAICAASVMQGTLVERLVRWLVSLLTANTLTPALGIQSAAEAMAAAFGVALVSFIVLKGIELGLPRLLPQLLRIKFILALAKAFGIDVDQARGGK